MKNLKAQKVGSLIVCKANASSWVLLLLFGALGAGILWAGYSSLNPTPPQQRDLSGSAFLMLTGLLLLIPSLIAAYWTCRARVEATEDGLRWRGLGKWKSAAWSEVRDFYRLEPQKGQQFHVVETAAGKLHLSGFYGNTKPFLDAVAARAVYAPVKAWEQLGCRLGNVAPCRFSYSRRAIQASIALFTVVGAAMLFLITPPTFSKLTQTSQTIGATWAISLVASYVLVIAMTLAPVPLLISIARRSLKGANQKIQTSSEGIEFTDGEQYITTSWGEVLQYGVPQETAASALRGEFHVRSRHGDFSFSQHIRDFSLLCQIIRHWAPEETSEIKKSERADVLGSESMRWTGARPGVGNRVFHYKTRTNRALLVNLIGVTMMPIFVPILEKSLGLPPRLTPMSWCTLQRRF
ncbi:MAG: hypothetical protein ABIY70_24340 [Capsulimonas sp.]|uniref:hypothetical protein n=1 Tax=Capsulimonas sp. TaxID=2494211 RepID=UPI0032666B61